MCRHNNRKGRQGFQCFWRPWTLLFFHRGKFQLDKLFNSYLINRLIIFNRDQLKTGTVLGEGVLLVFFAMYVKDDTGHKF